MNANPIVPRGSIRPADPEATSRQFYLPDTNVLVTRFATAGGR